MSDKQNPKRAKTLRQAQSVVPTTQQLSLWQIPQKGFSRTAELYDFIPRFVFGKQGEDDFDDKGRLKPIDREFNYSNQNYKVYVGTVQIKNENKKGQEDDNIFCLPGKRERIIEDVLRKFAVDGKTYSIDNRLGVVFTEYELFEELKKRGHTFSYVEIRQALEVLTSATIKLHKVLSVKNEQILKEPFMTMVSETEEGWKGNGKRNAHLVFFNSLIKESIAKQTYRRYDYELCMGYKNEISVYLHKRLSHRFIQASYDKSYEIRLSTIIEGCGLKRQKYLSWENKSVIQALEEMKKNNVLLKWEVKKIRGDYQYQIFASPKFCNEMRGSNVEQGKLIDISGL